MNDNVRKFEIAQCYICNSSKVKSYSEVNGFVVAKCHACGLLWVININKNDVESFYNGSYFNNESKIGYRNYLNDEENHRENAKRILGIVNRIKDLGNLKILDIGCAFGFLLDEARSLGTCDAYGIEISRYAREYAAKKLGLTNIDEDDEMRNAKSDFFDVVFLIGTLEHLVSPKKTLRNITRVLKQGGVLVITTIDTKGIVPLYSIKPPEHIFYFNHNNIISLLNEAGFKIILKKPYFVRYYLHDLFYRLGEFLSVPFLNHLSKIMHKFMNISVTIPTNEMILIVEKL